MDKILFLDIDGVMNNIKTLQEGWKIFDPVAVEQLDRIIRTTGCKIVLSSTWRIAGITSIHGPLDNASIGHQDRAERIKATVFDKTPDYVGKGSAERGHEIQAWLDINKFEGKFVIVDDDSDMAHLKDHLVQTNFDDGLTKELADEIISRLGEQTVFAVRGH